MSNYSNKLIFGKEETERIVSIEHSGDEIIAFIQEKDGRVTKLTDASTFWFLTHEKISSKQTTLAGDQYFKYMGTFPNQEERDNIIKVLKKEGIEFYRIYDHKEQSLVYNGMTYFKGLQPKEVSILCFDIETTGLLHNDDSETLLISNTYRDSKGKITKKLFGYDEFKNQGEMLKAWCNWVRRMDPSIICNHNIFGFDIPYLNHCAKLNGVYLNLGRDGSSIKFDMWDSSFRKDGSQDIEFRNCHIFGREIVDTMFLSYKYDFKREFPSYGLKPIINFLGLEKKDRVFYDAGEIRHKYMIPEEWVKIKAYAGDDSDDALALFDLMAPPIFYFTQSCSKSFQTMVNTATGSQMNNIMVRAYLQDGHSIAKGTEAENFEGAISFGIPGIYRNAFKQDVASLYPSIMRQYGIFCKEKDPKEYFKAVVEYFAVERLKNKKLYKETKEKYYDDLQEAQKIGANSLYGFLGAPGLNYNYPEGAAEVTRRGRDILGKAVMFATGQDVMKWKEKSEVLG